MWSEQTVLVGADSWAHKEQEPDAEHPRWKVEASDES